MRVKRGKVKHQKREKLLSKTKGFTMSYSKLRRRANEALLHAGSYSFNDRKKRSGQFRQLWIKRVNAALKKHELSYNEFINGLKKKKIELNRKILSELAINNPEVFDQVVAKIKA